jgi:hypothetical protein
MVHFHQNMLEWCLYYLYVLNIVYFVDLITEYILPFTFLHVHFLQLVLLADYIQAFMS